MKRLTSEAASQQFQFISADQFGSPSTSSSGLSLSQQQQALLGQRHLLQDGHFRRAGSQPPMSSHADRRAGPTQHLLPIGSAGAATIAPTVRPTNSTTGTVSSSSGVSSTTSSTLATSHTPTSSETSAGFQMKRDGSPSRQDNDTSSATVKQIGNHSSGLSWTSRIKRGSTGAQQQQQPKSPRGGGSQQQQQSGGLAAYTESSRYRPQRAPPDKRQSVQLTNGASNVGRPVDAKRQLRAQSEVKQLEELRRKAIAIAKSSSPAALIGNSKSKMSLQRFRRRLRQDSMSDEAEPECDDNDDDDDDDVDAERDARGPVAERRGSLARTSKRPPIEQPDDDDSDLNEIYSTPNDSIQSVPSGQLVFEPSQRRASTAVAQQQPPPPQQQQQNKRQTGSASKSPELDSLKVGPASYQMTKSFSANHFDQLLCDNGAATNRPKRAADERPKLAGSTILEVEADQKRQQPASKSRSSGSRFFISSSSSEDSNPPPPQQQPTLVHSNQTSTNGDRPASQRSPSNQLGPPSQPAPAGHRQQIPVQSGLHYHGPAGPTGTGESGAKLVRPSSLSFVAPSPVLILQPPISQPSAQTPNTFILNGVVGGHLEPTAAVIGNVAAMTPGVCAMTNNSNNNNNNMSNLGARDQSDAFPQIASNKLPSCQLVTNVINSGASYRKSPSLFDIKPAASTNSSNLVHRFSSKYPWTQRLGQQSDRPQMSSFVGANKRAHATKLNTRVIDSSSPQARNSQLPTVPNSISLHDCRLANFKPQNADSGLPKATAAMASNRLGQLEVGDGNDQASAECVQNELMAHDKRSSSEYKLAQMLLELGSNPAAKDESGFTALMHSILSENLPAFRCLVEHGVDLNETNHDGQSALDLICSKQANETLLEMVSLFSLTLLRLTC
jgi:ankyrin repeat protein